MATTVPSARSPADPHATVRSETIVNTVVTIAIAAGLTWLLFRGRTAIPAFALPPDGLFGVLPGTFNFTLLVTIVLTLVIRARVRRGGARPWPPPVPHARLPANVVLRGLAMASGTTLLFVPATALLLGVAVEAGVLPARWSFAGMLAFFCGYFALLSLFVTPVVVRRALAD